MMDNDDNESYSDVDERNEKSGDESEMDVEDLKEPENSIYSVWKTNAQYLYDLLLHNHTSWPSSTCAWGPIVNSEYLTPVSHLSQHIVLATHTDGSYNMNSKKWSKTPECVLISTVEMTRRRGTQTWYVAKYNESQRNRNFVTTKHIVHPGDIGRLKMIPETDWVVSHSNDSHLYLWNTKTQKNHSARDGTDASHPDISLKTCNNDTLTEYPLAVYSRKKAMFVRTTEIPLMKGSKIPAPEFFEQKETKKNHKRSGSSKKNSKKIKKNDEKEEEVEESVKEEKKETPVKEETPVIEETAHEEEDETPNEKEEENIKEEPVEKEELPDDHESETPVEEKEQEYEQKEVIEVKEETIDDVPEYRILCVSKNTLHLWNMKDISVNNSMNSELFELSDLLGEDTTIEDICFLDGFEKNGTLVGIAGTKGFVGIYDISKKELVWKNTSQHEGDVHCILNISVAQAYQKKPYEHMSKLLLTCGEDKKINVWDIETCLKDPEKKPLFNVETSSSILCIDFCPQIPRYIAVGTDSGEIDLFDLLAEGAEEYLVLRHLGHRTAVNDLQFNPFELLTILSCSNDSGIGGGGSIQIWRPHELLMVKLDEEENDAIDEIVSIVKK